LSESAEASFTAAAALNPHRFFTSFFRLLLENNFRRPNSQGRPVRALTRTATGQLAPGRGTEGVSVFKQLYCLTCLWLSVLSTVAEKKGVVCCRGLLGLLFISNKMTTKIILSI
jgi:hypothetical protein